MPTRKSPRKGSLQFWPRKRVNKLLPRVNWDSIKSSKNLKGFICYKAGMMSAYVKDNTPDSMTKGKKIIVPITILECPTLKIFSIRLYKNGRVLKEVLAENLDKELKRKVKIPKKDIKKIDDIKEEYDNVRVIVYSQVKKTGIKKTPDLSEIGLVGNLEEKIKFIKENLNKEISVLDIFEKGELIDLRGLTKGKGLQGPVKRFGITLKSHKSEKGRRRPGSLGPWHPARVTFRVPQAGQLGTFTRIIYNNKIIDMGKSEDKLKNIKNFGNIKTDYILIRGSVQGPSKRQLLITAPLRKSRKQLKKDFELIELR
ncbi:MAG: 50S ribosomal protein L3 [Candidatus Pacearchaeota archaeon]|jgi:large subunit ribosomal protein L3|nr:50S ribosomal protein L3 [Candidatus Pacearchaeota archaeon]MDP7520738.1 50S ribosomal protein L3 [Candidatus Pacearchaeota archaeon]|tara:strand:+ start:1728 stop:2666 length:939 start_codon:yes stop_codon:yes gene_type:complete